VKEQVMAICASALWVSYSALFWAFNIAGKSVHFSLEVADEDLDFFADFLHPLDWRMTLFRKT
jgi:hypothetical protein